MTDEDRLAPLKPVRGKTCVVMLTTVVRAGQTVEGAPTWMRSKDANALIESGRARKARPLDCEIAGVPTEPTGPAEAEDDS